MNPDILPWVYLLSLVAVGAAAFAGGYAQGQVEAALERIRESAEEYQKEYAEARPTMLENQVELKLALAQLREQLKP